MVTELSKSAKSTARGSGGGTERIEFDDGGRFASVGLRFLTTIVVDS